MEVAVLPESAYRKEAGRRLRRLIDMLDIQYVEAARIMGITKHVLRNWMAGDSPIQPYALYRLSSVKQVDFNYVHLGDWSRLPKPLRDELEAETLAKLEEAAAANQASETDAAA